MVTRRSIFGAVPLALAGAPSLARPRAAEPYLRRAIEAAGGEAALRRAARLAWTGRAVVHAGERRIEIAVETVVRPFAYAKSISWPLDRGPTSSRTLEIDGDEGWTTIGGERKAAGMQLVRHERAQYGLYGLMRLVTLRDAGCRIEARALENGRYDLAIEHPSAPRTVLSFAPEGDLIAAVNLVPGDQGGFVFQRFRFEDRITDGNVRWPRRLTIAQGDRPYFELELESFSAGPTAA